MYGSVSVVIVNFNAGQLLTDCVQAVLASIFPVTVYVVDNASHDNSLHILQQNVDDKRVHITKNTDNIGFAPAINSVLPDITSDYLLLLNPDCLIRPNTIDLFVETMSKYPQAGIAGCLVRNLDGSEQAGCRRSVPTPWRAIVRVFLLDKLFPQYCKSFVLTCSPLPTKPIEIEGISGACMFVRNSALKIVGPMDEEYFLHCEDLDWFMRFRAEKFHILFIPSIEVTHVKGFCSRNQPIKVLWYKHRGMIRFYRKFFRTQYPRLLFGFVILAVWIRFALLVVKTKIFNS
ncbi:glycosyltransferase family 2 protein [Candidatus Halobeggiatoa sp. HSG11]|nr:glycosyltransferase family 2 protein [Candidatus Halobeggiatoa sp. HSG11]